MDKKTTLIVSRLSVAPFVIIGYHWLITEFLYSVFTITDDLGAKTIAILLTIIPIVIAMTLILIKEEML